MKAGDHMTEKDTIKKTIIFPKRLDNVLRIQAAISNRSQTDLIIDILEKSIDPKLYDLLDDAPKEIAASETAPQGKDK